MTEEQAQFRGFAATARQPSPIKDSLGLPSRSSRRRAKDGGPDRDRTGDLVNAIHARSQLRYWPTWEDPNI